MDADVIVVGAGISGATITRELTSQGYSVLLLERYSFPREKICSGGIFMQCIRDFPYIEPMIDCYNYSMDFYSSNIKKKFHIQSEEPIFASINNRMDFDQKLLNLSDSNLKTLKFGVRVEKVLQSNDVIKVMTDNGIYCSKFIIGADSCISTVGRNLNIGLTSEIKNFGISIGKTFILSDKEIENYFSKNRTISIFLRYGGINGYGKIIPKKKEIYIGINSSFYPVFKLRKLFSEFLSFLKKKNYIPFNFDEKGSKIGIYPMKRSGRRCFGPNTFLIGDAAGFCSPLTGLGIYYGMKSAVLACQAVIKILRLSKNSFEIVPNYYRLVKKNIGFELDALQKFNNLFLSSDKNCNKLVNFIAKNDGYQQILIDYLKGLYKENITTELISNFYRKVM